MTVKQAKFTIHQLKTSVTGQRKCTHQNPFFQVRLQSRRGSKETDKVILNMPLCKMNRKRLSARGAATVPRYLNRYYLHLHPHLVNAGLVHPHAFHSLQINVLIFMTKLVQNVNSNRCITLTLWGTKCSGAPSLPFCTVKATICMWMSHKRRRCRRISGDTWEFKLTTGRSGQPYMYLAIYLISTCYLSINLFRYLSVYLEYIYLLWCVQMHSNWVVEMIRLKCPLRITWLSLREGTTRPSKTTKTNPFTVSEV